MMGGIRAQIRRTAQYFFGQSWVRFGIVGVAATIVYFVIGISLERAGVAVLVGNAVAYVLGFIVSYFGHKLWSFQSSASHGSALPRFLIAWFAGLGLNTLIIWALMRFGAPYVVAMWVAIVLVPVFTYFAQKFWVFRQPPERGPEK